RGVDVVVGGRIAVGRVVAIPRREVESGPKSLGRTGVDELANDVALAAAEWAGGDGVARGSGGPEAEAVVVLRREDQRAKASGLRRSSPLPGVQASGMEDGWI